MMKFYRRILCLLLTVATLAVSLAAPALASGYSAWINSSSAKIYLSPSKCGTVPAGTSVTVEDYYGSWALITIKGYDAVVKMKYLTAKNGITGYIKTKTSLYKSASSSSTALGTLTVCTQVDVVGVSGDYYQVTNSSNSVYGYVKGSCISKSKPAATSPTKWTSKVQITAWDDGGSSILTKGNYGYIYDIDTGIIVHIKRMGGSNHADVEPATTEDTAKLLKIAGGTFSWDSHAVILYAGGKYVAAAINTMPHGDQTIGNNNYDGQFCLHLYGSKTHASDDYNVNHQISVVRAYNWAKSK